MTNRRPLALAQLILRSSRRTLSNEGAFASRCPAMRMEGALYARPTPAKPVALPSKGDLAGQLPVMRPAVWPVHSRSLTTASASALPLTERPQFCSSARETPVSLRAVVEMKTWFVNRRSAQRGGRDAIVIYTHRTIVGALRETRLTHLSS